MSNENHWINTHAHRDTHLLPHRDAFTERTKNSLKCSLEGCKVICTEGGKKANRQWKHIGAYDVHLRPEKASH